MQVNSTATRDAKMCAAAVSHDCKLAAVAFTTVIEIRSVATPCDSVKTIKTKSSGFRNLMFSPYSAYIAAQFSISGSLEVWPLRGGQSTVIQGCLAAAYYSDSSFMALKLRDFIEIRRVDKASLNFHRKICIGDRQMEHARNLTFSHDAALLAISLPDSRFGVWLTDTGECLWTANDHTSAITSLLFSRDSTFLVSSSFDKTLRIYSVSKQRIPEVHERKHEQVRSIAISPDSSLILLEPSMYQDNKLWQILQADSGICVEELGRDKLQSEPTFTHDSALAVIKGGAAEVWHADGRRSVQNLNGLDPDPSRVCVACFSPDFTLAAGILDDRSLRIWQMNTGECMRAVQSAVPNNHNPETLYFSPDTCRIAYISNYGEELFVWQVKSDAVVQRFNLSGSVDCFALSNTKLAATSILYGDLKIWSLETSDILQSLNNANTVDARKLSFSYDSTILASAKSRTIQVWNADTGACMQIINVGLGITHLSFGPNNNSGLRTNLGRLKSKDSPTLGEDADGVGRFQLWHYDKLGYSNGDGGSWITFNGEKLLWLPAKYRGLTGTSRAVSESVVAMVSNSSGQDAIIGFDLEKMPRSYHDTHRYFGSIADNERNPIV